MIGRVLLYRCGALGDTLLSVAALDALRRRFPGARVALAARPAWGSPLLDAGRVDELLDAEARPFHLLYQEPSPGDELDLLLRGFGASLFFTLDPEGGAARRLGALPRGDHLLASPFPPEGEDVHIARWMEGAAAPLGAAPGPFPPPPLIPSAASREKARRLTAPLGLDEAPLLALHPGSGGRGKWAPPGALARVARDFCGEGGPPPLLIQGPADREAVRGLQAAWGGPLPVVEAPPPEVLGALLAQSSAYLGCDSGVSHLAALAGTPALVLAGPASTPARWGPIGRRAGWIPWEEAERGAARLRELAGRGTGPAVMGDMP
jgi:ADP-heptose:LPS heptosyltransferase